MRVRIERLEYSAAAGIWIFERTQDRVAVAKPVTLEFVDQGDGGAFRLPDPTLTIPYSKEAEFFQNLADELRNQGVKPKDQHRLEGTIEATREHLNDMRRLVFKNE